jgi:hypothetical protein
MAIIEKWFHHPAAEIWVFRDAENSPAGFVLKLNMEKIKEKTHDEAINRVRPFIKQAGIADDQLITVFRSWMSRDSYQNVSAVQSAIFLGIVQWYFTPGLALSMLHVASPEFWKQILNYADLSHDPGYDYEENKRLYGWYYHDWRKRPPVAWLELMGKKEINEEEETVTREKPSSAVSLTETSFINSVYDALKNLRNQKKLRESDLLKLKFVQKSTTEESTPVNLALTLADKLTKAIASLENSPSEENFHRILYRSFINPVGTQEQTADFLYMSFSTYRRQVKKAVEKVADILWLEENRS